MEPLLSRPLFRSTFGTAKQLTQVDMRFDLRHPCDNCPFRRTPLFPLGTARREGIAADLSDDHSAFFCHKTTRFDEDGIHLPHENEQHCAGAMLVLEKLGRPNIPMRIAQLVGIYSPEQLQEWDAVYDSLADFAHGEDGSDLLPY